MTKAHARVIGVLATSLTCVAVAAARQATVGPVSGTAALAGVVTESGSDHPVRHATVSISTSGVPPRTINTDDNGRFAFGGLTGGSYAVYVRAGGYVQTQYGASAPGRTGAAIVLSGGQRIDNVNIALVRCASISGTVTVQTNERVELAVQLQKWTYSSATGQRTLGPAGVAQGAIDDRGVYRIHDVPPGSYVVVVNELMREGIHGISQGEVVPTTVTHADVQAALLGGRPASAQTATGGEAPVSTTWAPTFFPGTAIAAEAATIAVGPGEERTGVDLTVRMVPVVTVSGTIVPPPGVTSRDISVRIFPVDPETSSSPSFNGFAQVADTWMFSVRGVRPGRYIVTAHALVPPAGSAPGSAPARVLWWAEEPVVVDGRDISNLTLALQSGVVVSGHVQFSPSGPEAATFAQLRIGLTAIAAEGRISASNAAASIDAGGRFTIGGVTPGRYRFELNPSGGLPRDSGWWLESAIVNGKNAADVPIEIGATASFEPLLTLTNRARPQLTGTVRDAAGSAVRDATVVVFTTSREGWPAPSRRVTSARPSAEGSFTIRNLLPGEYFVVALGNVEGSQWLDPAFLEGLAAAGPAKVTLGDGETANLRVTVK